MANFSFHISGLLINFRAPSGHIQRIASSNILFFARQLVAVAIEQSAFYFFAFFNRFAAITAFFLHLTPSESGWVLIAANKSVYWPTFTIDLLLNSCGLAFLLAVINIDNNILRLTVK
jgi:hypothetical protein